MCAQPRRAQLLIPQSTVITGGKRPCEKNAGDNKVPCQIREEDDLKLIVSLIPASELLEARPTEQPVDKDEGGRMYEGNGSRVQI
jgi:hypothetical protein